MKRETFLKIILLVVIGVVLFARPITLYAVSSSPTDINDFWEDQGGLDDFETTSDSEKETTTPTQTTPEPEKETTTPVTKPSEELPKAGLAEDTMMIVSGLVLIGIAVFAFIKISDYSNI